MECNCVFDEYNVSFLVGGSFSYPTACRLPARDGFAPKCPIEKGDCKEMK